MNSQIKYIMNKQVANHARTNEPKQTIGVLKKLKI